MSVPVQWVVGLMVALEPSAPWRATFEKSAEAIARVSESDPLWTDHGEERTAALGRVCQNLEGALHGVLQRHDGRALGDARDVEHRLLGQVDETLDFAVVPVALGGEALARGDELAHAPLFADHLGVGFDVSHRRGRVGQLGQGRLGPEGHAGAGEIF